MPGRRDIKVQLNYNLCTIVFVEEKWEGPTVLDLPHQGGKNRPW
jgi:hypothetical protein